MEGLSVTENFTSESVKRIERVNELQISLNSDEKARKLKELGVISIGFFGSAANGTAKEKSDIDLYVIHRGKNDYDFPGYSQANLLEQKKAQEEYDSRIGQILQSTGVGEIMIGNNSPVRARLAQEENPDRSRIVEVTVIGQDEQFLYDRKTGKPKVNGIPINGGVEIWNRGKRPNLISRVLKLGPHR